MTYEKPQPKQKNENMKKQTKTTKTLFHEVENDLENV